MKEDSVHFRSQPELFIIHGRVVASQPSYVIYQKEATYEVKHYYCTRCGDEWGRRVVIDASPSFHHFYSSPCKSCGGEEDMLCPFEWQNLDVLGENVMAYIILDRTE